MSTAFQRGLVLYEQSRYDLAEREFRHALAEQPDAGIAHAYLALCLAERDQGTEALAEADLAVQSDPDTDFFHYVRGAVLLKLGRFREAAVAAREAIRIEPAQSLYHGLLAGVEAARQNWTEALSAANQGLALNAEDLHCVNLRAMALVHLGMKDEASQTLGSALADDPENALTHANQGWNLLHRGDPAQALIHFREALRLDPELEWARVGIVEALKARHWIYRQMLAFFLWMSRQSRRAQWVIILGFVFGRSILAQVAKTNPSLAPFLMPVIYLSFAFLLMTWIASPLFNLLLRFNKFGRLALSDDQRTESTWIGGCVFCALVALVVQIATGSALSFFALGFFAFFLFPLVVTFQQARDQRWKMGLYSAAIVALAAPLLVTVALNREVGVSVDRCVELFQYSFYGSILASWLPAVLGVRRSMR
jgi:tetratricopeptide (TPR) repeat protein